MIRKVSISLLIIIQFWFFPLGSMARIWASEMPTPPTAPTATTAPESPDAPTPPEVPQAPEPPTTETQEPPSAPSPTDVPQASDIPQAPQPSPTPTSKVSTKKETAALNEQPPADASGQSTAENNKTGAGSNNESGVADNQDTKVKTDNQAEVNNDLVLTSDSGHSSADKNTGDGSVTSGDATVQGVVKNQANTTVTTTTNCTTCGSSGGSAQNNQTGADSNNQADTTVNSDTIIENNQNANLDTGVIAIADSGHNSADKNTGNGEVITGDANVGLTVVNVANTDITGVQTSEYDVYDDHRGDIVIGGDATGNGNQASNQQTGADSNNQVAADNNTALTIVNNNDATVANDLVVDATTGHNSADKNTGDGSVTTGDVNVITNAVNLVNSTADVLVATVNIFGDLVGDIILSPLAGCSDCGDGSQTATNNQTGAGSNNESDTLVQRYNTVSQHNEANINNQVVVNSNTGGNQADRNTEGGSVETGSVDVQADEVTVANNNIVGDGETLWIVVVNEAGKWVGKILGAGEDDHLAVVDTFDLGAANDTTGADSNNQASSEQNSTTTIEQNNQADVNNQVVINADTGHNTAEANTGSGNISTGDVNVYQNVINYVNNNVVGGKVVIAFVNVFGSWIGDVVTPGHEKQSAEASSTPDQNNNQGEELAIGGVDFTPTDEGNQEEPATTNSETENTQSTNDESGILTEEDAQDWVANSQSSSLHYTGPDPRLLAGTWLREEDPFLQTTPAPEPKVESAAVGPLKFGLKDTDKNLVYLLMIVSPLGMAAAKLKKRVLIGD